MNTLKKLTYSKKFIIYFTILYIAIIAGLAVCNINHIDDYKNKTLGYFYNITTVTKNNEKMYKWHLGVPSSKDTRYIIQTSANEKELREFKNSLDATDEKKHGILLKISCLIYFIISLIIECNNKNIKNVQFLKGFDVSAILFIFIMIIETFFQLDSLLRNVLNAYNLIP